MKRTATLCILLCTTVFAFADELLVKANLDEFGSMVHGFRVDAREALLRRIKLGPEVPDDPDIEHLILFLNAELCERKIEFRIAIHIDKDSTEYWQLVRKLRLSQITSFNKKAVRERFLKQSSLFDLLREIGLDTGLATDPLYYERYMILSASVGYRNGPIQDDFP